MKKYCVLFLVITFLFCCICVSAQDNENFDILASLQILPTDINYTNGNNAVTKEQLAYIVTKLFGSGVEETTDTKFNDVKKDNIFSGYIQQAVSMQFLNGESDEIFNPKGNINIKMADKVFVKLLGYDDIAQEKGGYPDGYVSVASELGLNKNVQTDSDGYITYNGIVNLIFNVLIAQKSNFAYSYEDGELKGISEKISESGILGDNLGISVYTGTVRKVIDSNYKAVVTISGNKYKSNKTILEEGSVHTFGVSGLIDINRFEDVPATFWVDRDDNIVCIIPQKNIEIKYAYIASVNGDSDESHTYSMKYIDRLTLFDDSKKYSVRQGSQLKINGGFTEAPFKLIGNFAKIVLDNDDVVFMECWDLKGGGLITAISKNSVTYIKGSLGQVKINDFDKYKKRLVFIDGQSVDVKDLKTDSVFQYYERENDYIIIVASEKAISEKFNGISESDIDIGNIYYSKSDRFYYSEDGKRYKDDNAPDALFGMMVDAYFDAKGNCTYVKPKAGEVSKELKFLGIVGKYKAKPFSEVEIVIWQLEPKIEKKVYLINSKTKYKDGLTLSDITSYPESLSGEGLYEFTVNGSGRVVSVSNASPFYGFGSAAANVTSFADDSIAFLSVSGKTLFFTDARIVVLCKIADEFAVRETMWSELRKKVATNVTMRFLGDNESSAIRLALICGDTSTIYGSDNMYGVISGKTIAVDEDGTVYYRVNVQSKKNSDTKKLTQKTGQTLPDNAYIIYRQGSTFDEDQIVIKQIESLPDKIEDWSVSGLLKKGVVKKIDSKMLILQDGTAYFLHPTLCNVFKVNDDKKNRFDLAAAEDIQPGSEVYFNQSGDIKAIFFK